MSNNTTNTLKKDQFLSSGIIEVKIGSEWEKVAGFTDLVVSSEPFTKETAPTDDGVAGLKTVRQDGKAAFNLRMAKNPVLMDRLFQLPTVYTTGVAVSITAELVDVDLKAGDGVYEAILTKMSGNGTKNTAITVKNEAGTVTYVLDTDYTVEMVNGYTSIRMISGGAISKGDVLSVDYTYLPLVKAVISAGEAKVLESRAFRFREAPNTAGSSITTNLMEIEFPVADIVSGLNFGFPDMSAEKDEFEMSIEIETRKGEEFFTTFTAR